MSAVVARTARCSRCGKLKPLSAFTVHPARPRGVLSQCKDCYADRARTRRASSPSPSDLDHPKRSRAYVAAQRQLRERHRAEFDRLYRAARRAEGLA